MQKVAQALTLTAEVFNVQLSVPRMKMMIDDLAGNSPEDLIEAIEKCRKELRFMPTVADILSRIPGSFVSADEAWALMPKNERDTGVVTDEMLAAWGVAASLYESSDETAARMAFRAAYDRAVSDARSAGSRASWTVSPGSDKAQHLPVVQRAVECGKIALAHALALLPQYAAELTGAAGLERELNAAPQSPQLPATSAEKNKYIPWDGTVDMKKYEHIGKGQLTTVLRSEGLSEHDIKRKAMRIIVLACEKWGQKMQAQQAKYR